MMTVEPTCRYCQRRLGDCKSAYLYYEFECKPCRSTQYFESSGKSRHYLFRIGPYKLYFMPDTYSIPKFQLCNGNLGPIVELDYLPHNLTPQTTTIERIKTLILFS